MTVVRAELLSIFISPGTGLTSTFSVVFVANWTAPRSVNVTVFCSPALIEVDRLRLHDRRCRVLLDRQRDRDLHLLRVARVLDGDREREVGATP